MRMLELLGGLLVASILAVGTYRMLLILLRKIEPTNKGEQK